jgi:hypothetical protein
VLAMIDAKADFIQRGSMGSELVCDHDARRRNGGFQEFRHEPPRREAVSSTLHQNIENETMLVNRAPKPVGLASDRDDDFIQMPFVAARGSTLADLVGKRATEFVRPLAHRLVAHANAARRKHLLDHAKAQRKPEIEPNRSL